MLPETALDFDLHLPNAVRDRPVQRVFAKEPQIRVSGQPLEIAVTEREGFLQRGGSEVKFRIQGMAAGQIVENQRIARFETRQLFVDLQATLVSAALSVVVAQDLERLDIIGVAVDDSFQEADFNIEVSDLLT